MSLAAGVLAVVLLLFFSSPSYGGSHNITAILAAHPDLATFNGLLTDTRLAADINNRTTITVLAVDNAALAPLQARGLLIATLRHVLSLHVLVDYFDAVKLHRLPEGSALVSTLYQASGDAPGSAGIVNITARLGGRVAFAPHDSEDAPPTVFYVRSLQESPYDIAVLQVSAVISSLAAAAPVPVTSPSLSPAPAETRPNLKDIMSKNGCGGFADLLTATADAAKAYQQSMEGGLTVFCPADKAVAAFAPAFENLTANGRVDLLLYHGVPTHYSWLSLKAINGDVDTLATDEAKSYNLTLHGDVDTVTLVSAAQRAARVTGTVVDKKSLAVYSIDAVLLPRELFNGSVAAPTPVYAPAPAPVPKLMPSPAPVSAPSSKHHSSPAPGPSDAIAPSPDDYDYDTGDDSDEKNGAGGAAPWRLAVAVAAAVPALAWVVW